MQLVDKLREEAFSEHVAFTEFVLKIGIKRDVLFCFFEGKDDYKYYGIRIDNIYQKDFDYINCGGKEIVLKVEKLIRKKKEYRKIRIAFFIDRDYEQLLATDKIYCLPSYSIENQYVSKKVLTKILLNEFSLRVEEDDFKLVISIFEFLQNKFHQDTLFVNAWLACQSDFRRKNNINTHLKIEKSLSGHFKSIVNSDLSTIKDFSDLNNLPIIQNLFPEAPLVNEELLTGKIDEFKLVDSVYMFRGKFEFLFFINFLDRLKSEICKKQSTIFKFRHVCSLRFEISTSLTVLSIYAETQECLINYLNLRK